ncbi:hypothetical protein PG988_007346 [Apiospora saccharicola]
MIYQSLQTSRAEIRLLRILPSSTAQTEAESPLPAPVSCELQNYSLDETVLGLGQKAPLEWDSTTDKLAPELSQVARYKWGDFVALSYTWGDPAHTAEILVNGTVVAVRTNLEAALRALRHKQPIVEGMLVWVDAICINQGDMKERESEVKRMRTIYKFAYDVVVWLGKEDEGSRSAIVMLKTMGASVAGDSQDSLERSIRQDPGMFGAGSWKALGLLLNRPYWNRVWIMQELAMGTETTPILCGEDTMTWGELYHGVYEFGRRIDDLMFLHIEMESKKAGVDYRGLNRQKIIHLRMEQLVQAGATFSHHMSVLDLARKSYATDLRDKVYGILGLVPPQVATLTDVNYQKEPHEVYTSFTGAWMVANILEQCSTFTHRPTWVPDLNSWDHVRLFSGTPCYFATKGLPTSFTFLEGGMTLSVEGVRVGIIDGLGASYYENHVSTEPSDRLVQPEGMLNAYGSAEGLEDAVWRTLVGNRTPNGSLAPDTYKCLLELALPQEEEAGISDSGLGRGHKTFNHLLRQNKDLMICGRKLGSLFPVKDCKMSAQSKDCLQALERMFRFHRSRRLAVTDNGRFGLAPLAAMRNDYIFMLPGCHVPIAARYVDNAYQVVGACYLQGFMEGEIVKDIQEGNQRLERIHFC